MSKIYEIGDVYYEKHTVVGVSHRNGEVSETQIEVIKDIIPLSVIDEIKAEILNLSEGVEPERIWNIDVFDIIDRKVKEHTSCEKTSSPS